MKRITLIDLNNFSFFPTMAIGYLSRYIKDAGYELDIMIPMSQGIESRKREKVEKTRDYVIDKIRHSNYMPFRMLIHYSKRIAAINERYMKKTKIFGYIKSHINLDTDLVLISTYTENYSICKKVAKLMKDNGVPVIIGGPGFNDTNHVKDFLQIPGVDYLVGYEVDNTLGGILDDYFKGVDISERPGIYSPKKTEELVASDYIFKEVETLPIPDFSSFPWEKYPLRVIPYLTARGCGWSKCTFCTDVLYVNGRTYRPQSTEKILHELKVLCDTVGTNIITFIDIKLNSNVQIWNELIENLPKVIKDPKWFCFVHVDNRQKNGLSLETLKKAKAAGLTRISFGFESASQHLLDHMKKGTQVENLEEFVQNAKEAGISLRASMFLGYLNEKDTDLKATYEFIERNKDCFDRLKLNRFQVSEITPVYQDIKNTPGARVYDNRIIQSGKGPKYRYWKSRILKIVHEINSKPLSPDAVKYDGVW